MLLNDVFVSVKKEIAASGAIKEIVLNGAFTGVRLENGDMGIAMNVRSGITVGEETRKYLESLIGGDGFSVCESLFSGMSGVKPPERFLLNSLLVALFNALSAPLMSEPRLLEKGYAVSSGKEGPGQCMREGETVTIVGYGGMIRPISKIAGRTYVTELEPELFASYLINSKGIAKGPDCARVVESASQEEYFARSDRIFVTGCTLVTDTMDGILRSCRGKHIVVYGATAGFFPETLFLSGVESIHTMKVIDPELMSDILLNCAGAAERFFPSACESLLISAKQTAF